MIFQVGRYGWSVGAVFVPAGTIITIGAGDVYSQAAVGKTIPMDCTPMDDEAKAALAAQQKRVGYKYPY